MNDTRHRLCTPRYIPSICKHTNTRTPKNANWKSETLIPLHTHRCLVEDANRVRAGRRAELREIGSNSNSVRGCGQSDARPLVRARAIAIPHVSLGPALIHRYAQSAEGQTTHIAQLVLQFCLQIRKITINLPKYLHQFVTTNKTGETLIYTNKSTKRLTLSPLLRCRWLGSHSTTRRSTTTADQTRCNWANGPRTCRPNRRHQCEHHLHWPQWHLSYICVM